MKWLAVALLLVVAGCSSGGRGGGNPQAFCADLRAQATASDSGDDAQEAAIFSRLADEAPAEIKHEMQQLRDFDALLTQSGSSSDALAAIQSSQSQIDTALNKVTAYAKDNCSVDLKSGQSTTFSSVANSIN